MCFGLKAQFNQSLDFSWAADSMQVGSDTNITLCEGQGVVVYLNTSIPHQQNLASQIPVTAGHPIHSVLIPYPTVGTPLSLTVNLSFSIPVSDLRVLIRDLDDDTPAFWPQETLSDILINGSPRLPDQIIATQGGFSASSISVVGTGPDCNGWFVWNGPGIKSLDFSYTRENDNYAFLLDSLEFSCDNTVGWADEQGVLPLLVAPNPASTEVLILFPNGSLARGGKLGLRMLDLAGRVVKEMELSEEPAMTGYRLDVVDVPSGMYLLDVRQGKRRALMRVVVAQD